MAFDYFTIQALAQELQGRLQGAVIERACAQPTELAFAVDEGDWLYGVSGREGLLCLRHEAWPRSWRAGDGPEKYLVRARIVDVEAEHHERILRLCLERRDRGGRPSFGVLVCELIPNKVRFVLHRQADDEILGYWGTAKDKSPVGNPYQPPEPSGRLLPGTDELSAWRDRLASADAVLEKAARRWLAGADASVVRELTFRSQQGGGGEPITALWNAATEAYTSALALTGQSYMWQEAGRVHFSALEPRRLQGAYEQFDAVSPGIWAAYQKEQEQRRQQQTQQQIRRRLGQTLKNARRRLAAMQVEFDEAARAEEYKRKGHALWANIGQLSGRPAQVELADLFDSQGGSTLRIDLDINRSLAENAASYLKAAQKYERRQQVLPQHLAELRRQCDQYEHWISAVDASTWESNDALQNWLESKVISTDKKASKQPQAHPRRYRTSTGWSVWVGRNNKENDLLTHRMSAQNDLWFHARGYAGSHVVLRSEGRKEAPSKQTIEETAALAAYWSKGKTAKKVSVAYTLVKHVTKPRGGAPGQALLRREKTIIVEPALLEKESVE
ncbi:MAG: NFACT RNA binding domain-containing protein [Gemmatimonadota bacterium]|nr:NFACT RNA binding domain-containing protein [Gemmatimonadota bacterium]